MRKTTLEQDIVVTTCVTNFRLPLKQNTSNKNSLDQNSKHERLVHQKRVSRQVRTTVRGMQPTDTPPATNRAPRQNSIEHTRTNRLKCAMSIAPNVRNTCAQHAHITRYTRKRPHAKTACQNWTTTCCHGQSESSESYPLTPTNQWRPFLDPPERASYLGGHDSPSFPP